MTLQGFDNRFVAELPGEREPLPGPHPVQGALWSAAMPTPVAAPRLLAHTPELARQLGFDPVTVASEGFAEVFGGNALYAGMQPFAANYGGHQFGHWAGQLGDGRAISLGERVDADGQRHELQLKGAGRTPYSRGADGRAVLRSSIREFLCSEAMHHLGVPTTRALSLVATGEPVLRDMFYDGHPRAEPGAVVCRVAPSFVRFGSFELPASRGDTGLLRQLADFVLARDFPHLQGDGQAVYAAWFAEICERTAELVAHWMRVGFVHGVMNTDNMSILGLTLDYGPYGWIEDYDPDWTPNTTDAQGRRYRFGTQPQVAYWNLGRLAQALAPLFTDVGALNDGLAAFGQRYLACQRRDAAAKLGLEEVSGEVAASLLEPLLVLMRQGEMDMTLTFRGLIQVDLDRPGLEPLQPAFYSPERQAEVWPALLAWREDYLAQLRAESADGGWRRERMRRANPCYVLRNYLAQQAIDQAEGGDLSGLQALQALLRDPYREQAGREAYAAPRPEWARHRAGCSMLSCSS